MKRKTLLILVAFLITAISLATFVGCTDKNRVENKLTYDRKYIYDDHIDKSEGEQIYFIFSSDGIGKYHCYQERPNYEDRPNDVYSYTISFIYINNTENGVVYCFYDSVEFDAVDNAKYVFGGSTWTATYTYNNDLLASIGGETYFICEDFIDKIPNFGGAVD